MNASRARPNAIMSRANSPASAAKPSNIKRLDADCWLSDSTTVLDAVPTGRVTPPETLGRMSSMTLPRSRSATLHETTMRRPTFSRSTMLGPSSRTTLATVLMGTTEPSAASMGSIEMRIEVGPCELVELHHGIE